MKQKTENSNKKKVLIGIIACMLCVIMTAGAILAFLTARDSVTNTFTLGNVDIEVLEPGYPGNNSPDVKNLVPWDEVTKDPVVHNIGQNDAVVFMAVTLPVNEGNDVLDWKKLPDGGYNSIDAEWKQLDMVILKDVYGNVVADRADAATVTYVYGWSEVLPVDGTTNSLFDMVRIANNGNGIAGSVIDMVIDGYAIQSTNVVDVPAGGKLDVDALGKAYEAFTASLPDDNGGLDDFGQVSTAAADWKYTLDEDGGVIVLNSYIGEKTDVRVCNSYEVDGKTYQTKLGNNDGNGSYMFESTDVVNVSFEAGIDMSDVTNMSHMFDGCNSLATLDLGSFDTSSVTDMSYMFCNCMSLEALDLGSFDTSNVTNMGSMFSYCGASSLNVSSFDTSRVTNMGSMFWSSGVDGTLDIRNFTVGSDVDCDDMFSQMRWTTEIIVSNTKWTYPEEELDFYGVGSQAGDYFWFMGLTYVD